MRIWWVEMLIFSLNFIPRLVVVVLRCLAWYWGGGGGGGGIVWVRQTSDLGSEQIFTISQSLSHTTLSLLMMARKLSLSLSQSLYVWSKLRLIEFWLKQSQPTCLYHSSARHIWVRNGREILPLNIKYLNCHTHSSNSPPLSFNPEQLSIFPINVGQAGAMWCGLLEVEPILKSKQSVTFLLPESSSWLPALHTV